ncbi:MAG: TenA family protein [Actinomycetota bacterium]
MLEPRSQDVSGMLHEAGADAWARATGHPMVREIAAGSLPHETFRRYFEQNVLYLEDYARSISLIASKAPDRRALSTLSRFLGQIVEHEIPANLSFLERLGGDPAALGGVASLAPAAYDYTRHLLATCAQGDVVEGLTAVLPCQWSYGELAQPLMESTPQDPIYADWIRMFGNDAYGALVEETTALLDRLADPHDKARMATLFPIFERSTRYEVAFWDLAYHGPDTAHP